MAALGRRERHRPVTPDPAYVALALAPGIGPVRLDTLLRAFGSAGAAIQASLGELESLPSMTRAAARAVRRADPASAELVVRRTAELGGVILTPDAAGFPGPLRDIPDPPSLLFASGEIDVLAEPGVAIVGSRDHTSYGARVARRLARGCAQAGLTVVSGMARGLDAVAHEGALDAGGRTLGVLGSGLGIVYPASNRSLYARMEHGGCLVTEMPPDTRPTAGSFPRRNRILSGLSRVVVVVEARPGSGALITADCALNQGRDVAAVPGPIDRASSVGTNRLIQLGAKPVLDSRDILEEFGITVPERSVPVPTDLDPDQRAILASVRDGTSRTDDLVSRVGTSASAVLGLVTELEIRGLIRRGPDGWHPADA